MAPAWTWSRTALAAGERRKVKPVAAIFPACSAAATMASASSTLEASGFSHSTCLPAASRASAIGRCRWLATTMLTASMSSASATACQLVSYRSNPYRSAWLRANCSFRSATAARRTGGASVPKTVWAVR